MSNSEVKFWAIIAKIQTMADGGLRVYLDLPEDAIETASILMEYKRFEIVADVTVRPKQGDESEGEPKTRKSKF